VKGSYRRKGKRNSVRRKPRNLLPALAVIGGACSLATTPANALELGEVQIESTLGQPLRASIAYALNPHEQLFDFCVSLRPGVPGSAIPTVSRARVSVTAGAIILTGRTSVRDPLLNVQVAVDCPYTPHLVREYTLIVDPVLPDVTTRFAAEDTVIDQPVALPAPATTQETAIPRVNTPVRANRLRTDAPPIAMSAEYQVRPGDTISLIASRIENRTIGLWPAINALVAANPDAFLNGDADRLMAGSVLLIPDMATTTADTESSAAMIDRGTAEPEVAAPAAEVTVATDIVVTEAVEEIPPPATVYAPPEAMAATAEVLVEPEVAEIADAPVATEMQPGDVFVAPAASVTPPVVNTNTASGTSGAWSWLTWLGGSGLALILGLLFFGRTLRERFSSVAIGAPAEPAPIEDDEPTQSNPVINDVDFQFDDGISNQSISLDADLEAGTGLDESEDIDLAQDFGFTAADQADEDQAEDQLDLEITEEAAAEVAEHSTDIIPPNHRIDESSILEAEVSAGDEDYDLSMIVDATKQSVGEYDMTAKDLNAVQIDANGDDSEYSVSDDTLTREVDLQVLAQDYEDEFTATQALDQEIEKAAQQLAKRMEDAEVVDAAPLDLDLDPTAEMPSNVTNSEITAELTANIPTEIQAENDDHAADVDGTSNMAAAGSDVTIEMQIESGKIDTKKK